MQESKVRCSYRTVQKLSHFAAVLHSEEYRPSRKHRLA